MSQIIYVTQGDSGPDIILTLTDHDLGVPIDLTNLSSAALKFRAVNTKTVLTTIALTVVGSPELGQLLLVWPSGALAVPAPAFYEGEIELTEVGPKVITAFTHPRFYVQEQF